jgi:hypothetical protein
MGLSVRHHRDGYLRDSTEKRAKGKVGVAAPLAQFSAAGQIRESAPS